MCSNRRNRFAPTNPTRSRKQNKLTMVGQDRPSSGVSNVSGMDYLGSRLMMSITITQSTPHRQGKVPCCGISDPGQSYFPSLDQYWHVAAHFPVRTMMAQVLHVSSGVRLEAYSATQDFLFSVFGQ